MNYFQKAFKVSQTLAILCALLVSTIVVRSQSIVQTSSIAGGSSVFVKSKASRSKKRSFAKKRRTRAKRSKSQRKATRRKVVRSSRRVAKRNRVRRKIKKIEPKAYKEEQLAEVKRKTPEEAAVIIAGLAEYYLQNDNPDMAIEAYEQAIVLDPNLKDAKLGLSEVLTQKGDQALEDEDNVAAMGFYQKAIQNDDMNSSAYAGRGQAYDAVDDDVNARKDYEKALSIDPNMVQVKAPLGIILYQVGVEKNDLELVKEAGNLVSSAVADAPDSAESQFFLGLIRFKQERFDEAESALKKSISIDSTNDDAFYYLGAVLSENGKIENAIEQYKKALAIDDKNTLAWYELGVSYYNQEKWNESIKAFDESIKFNPNNTDEKRLAYADAHANRADAYRQIDELTKAVSNYRVAVNLIKDNPELWSNYGFVMGNKEKWNEAITAFKNATELDPNEYTYANLGWAYYNLALLDQSYRHPQARIDRNLKLAKPALEKALSFNDKFEPALLNLGIVQSELKDFNGAVESFEKANKVRKKWIPVMNGLGDSYSQLGKYKDAKEQYERVLKEEKNNGRALFGLGKCLFLLKDRKDARKIQKRLVEIDRKRANQLETFFRQTEAREN